MIIKYPTGFYKSVLPPVTTGNSITYTISNTEPPRGSLYFLKMNLRMASTSLPLEIEEATEEQFNGTLKAYRNTVNSGMPIRPVGTTIEFTDSFKQSENLNYNLNQSVNFDKFSNSNSTDPINAKLIKAYKKFQEQLVSVSQDLQNAYISIGNNEIEFNLLNASLEAVRQALKLDPLDSDLLEAKADIEVKLKIISDFIDSVNISISDLTTKKLQYEDSIRGLAKVIK